MNIVLFIFTMCVVQHLVILEKFLGVHIGVKSLCVSTLSALEGIQS